MRFLVDECLHESLVGVAHAAGFAATHVNHLGLSGQPDSGKLELHPGLIVLVPNVVPALQRALFGAALQHLAGREPVNRAIEVTLEGRSVQCVEYDLPRTEGSS